MAMSPGILKQALTIRACAYVEHCSVGKSAAIQKNQRFRGSTLGSWNLPVTRKRSASKEECKLRTNEGQNIVDSYPVDPVPLFESFSVTLLALPFQVQVSAYVIEA